MPLDPTIPTRLTPSPAPTEVLVEQRLGHLDREQRTRDRFRSGPASEFASPSYGSSAEEATLEYRREARLKGDPCAAAGGCTATGRVTASLDSAGYPTQQGRRPEDVVLLPRHECLETATHNELKTGETLVVRQVADVAMMAQVEWDVGW